MFVATSSVCFGDNYCDVPMFIESHWETFSNVSNFKEFNSTTNLPPEVRSSLVYRYNAPTPSGLVDPGVTLTATITNGCRLVWATTDGTNYVVYWERIPGPAITLQDQLEAGGADCFITAAVREAGKTNFIIFTGPCGFLSDGLNDYKAFIDSAAYWGALESNFPE